MADTSSFEAGIHGLQGYQRLTHTDDDGRTYPVYHRGVGPPVVVIHELAGISPALMRFADRVVERGFSAYVPSLIEVRAGGGPMRMLEATVRVCISAEFVKLAREKTSPIVSWLRSLSRKLHRDTGHSVGVVGMCLTGGFALAMAVEPHVAGPVMAHPSLPIAIGSRRRRDLGLDPTDLAALKARTDLHIFGVRFSEDLVAPRPRFERMREEFGDQFTCTAVPSGRRSQHGLSRWEHSVLNNRRLDPEMANDPARPDLERVVEDVLEFLEAEVGS